MLQKGPSTERDLAIVPKLTSLQTRTMSGDFIHQRHKPPSQLDRARELVVAVPQMQSGVNLARIVRAAGCFGITRIVAEGKGKVDAKIARDAVEFVEISWHRSLLPVLQKLKADGYRLVGLEQATRSLVIYDYQYPRRSVLVIGHERHGIREDELAVVDDVIEIPMHGQPHSHNAASSAIIGMYEYCRQFPQG